jgi:cell wall-associated NlpC family hydrolase
VAGTIVSARIVTSVAGGPASDRPAYARADQKVMLYAAIEVEHAGRRAWFSDAPAPRIAGKAVAAQPLAKAPGFELAWQRVEPTVANLSNTASGAFRFELIEYRPTSIPGAENRGAIAADVRPTLTPDHGNGVGTMRYQIVVTQGERTVASPGGEARRGRGSGGLTDAVSRVTIRRDDTYLGFLTEMYGQPYVWASAGLSDGSHQSERLEGSDCADLMVYGARRMGKKVPYTWTGGLPKVSKLLHAGTRGDDGIYRDKAGKPIPFTQPGDLVLFPRHVGALSVDRGTLGVLDDQDLWIHTLFDSPKEEAIEKSGFADKPVELRRFK